MSEDKPARRPAGPTRIEVLFEACPPHPVRSMFLMGWPVMLAIVLLAFLAGLLFPTMAVLLVVGAPLAVVGAFLMTAIKARGMRLTVTDEVVRVFSGKAGVSRDRSAIDRMVLVDGLKRRPLAPRAQALILLDAEGHALLLLSGLIWPPQVLERVVDLLSPVPVDRVGRRSTAGLTADYPKIFRDR